MGCVLNAWLQPHMTGWLGMSYSGLWVGFGICIISVICGLGVNYYDSKRESQLPVLNLVPEATQKVKLSTVRDFSTDYWLVVGTSCGIYVCVVPFFNIATGFMKERFEFSATDSGSIIVGYI